MESVKVKILKEKSRKKSFLGNFDENYISQGIELHSVDKPGVFYTEPVYNIYKKQYEFKDVKPGFYKLVDNGVERVDVGGILVPCMEVFEKNNFDLWR